MTPQLLSKLLELKQRDADTRSRLLEAGELYGVYSNEMQRVHSENAHQLDEIVSIHGWPGVSLVGQEGCRAAWLVAQHSNCTPELQRKFLAALRTASENGDVPAKQLAFLTDRILFNENKPQVFGTVLDWNKIGELSCEVEDPANLDSRRKDVGLPAFSEDLEAHKREVKAEGGTCPESIDVYKQKAHEWARRVGWLEQA
jgi:hypothetical protein